MSLILCSGCARHVRASSASSACPFCGVAIGERIIERARPSRRARAARILGVAAIGVACGGTTTSPNDSGTGSDSSDDSATMPFYGGPFPEAGTDASTADAGKNDASDASEDAADDAESGIALYGAPPPPDGG